MASVRGAPLLDLISAPPTWEACERVGPSLDLAEHPGGRLRALGVAEEYIIRSVREDGVAIVAAHMSGDTRRRPTPHDWNVFLQELLLLDQILKR